MSEAQPPTEDDESTDDQSDGDYRSDPTAGQLEQFARNLYFHGKLMTARDMELEQEYHVGRQNTFARTVAGEGIACGLGVDVEDDDDDGMDVTVDPGYAIDRSGRPVVVPDGANESFDRDTLKTAKPAMADPPADADDLVGFSLFVRVVECWTEQVPVNGSKNACGEDCTYNRVVEDYEVEVRKGVPDDPKPVYDVEFPTSEDFDPETGGVDADDHAEALYEIATSYATTTDQEGKEVQRSCPEGGEGLIFLGHYEQSGSDWIATEEVPRSHVYDNDMLYAAIARHATNFDNPHEVVASIEGVEPDDGDVGLESDSDHLTVTPEEDHRLSLDLDADLEALVDDAVTSIKDVDPDAGGDVDLTSDGSIEIDPGTNEISFSLAEDVESSSQTLHGVEPDEEDDIGLTSETRTITFGRDEAGHRVSIDLGKRVQLELDQHAVYLMDKTLKYAVESFYKVGRVFEETEAVAPASQAIRVAEAAVRGQVPFRDEEKYFEAVGELIRRTRQIDSVVGGLAAPEVYKLFNQALVQLDELYQSMTSEDGDPDISRERLVELTVALDWLCETAGWLRIEAEPTVTLPDGRPIESSIVADLVQGSGYPIKAGKSGGSVEDDGDVDTQDDDSDGDSDGGTIGGVVSDDFVVRDDVVTDDVALGDVEGIGSTREEALQDAGITSGAQLVDLDAGAVASLTGLSERVVRQLQENAEDELGE